MNSAVSLELTEHGFFLVELEVNGFVIHYTFPAFLDFLPGRKPGHYGEREGCYVHRKKKKKISCLWLSHALPGDERPKFESLLYRSPVCRQQPLDCYPVCPFHIVALPVCLNILMDHTSICKNCSFPGPWDNLWKVWLFLSLGISPLSTYWWDGKVPWITPRGCSLEAAQTHHAVGWDRTLSQMEFD